jgi:hypothetical protein
VDHRDGAAGAELRICAGVYWLDPEHGDGSVAELYSDWYPVGELEAAGVGELVAAIQRREQRAKAG